MVRYPVGRQQLIDEIQQHKPSWIARAKARTDVYRAAGEYTGLSEFWGEIKEVYIRLQHEKCAYCETKLQGAELASKVHEVEHYRPKSSVKTWPPAGNAFAPAWPLGGASGKGYYLMAYHPFNYAIACTRCNSTLKSNYFPVRGSRQVSGDDPVTLLAEQPLLVYPVSDVDEDPAALIGFEGVTARARQAGGPAHERAVTTIQFFQLNHEDLATRRAEMLLPLFLNLEALAAGPSPALASQLTKVIAAACAPSGQFSSCMRDFVDLYRTDPGKARQIGALLLSNLPG